MIATDMGALYVVRLEAETGKAFVLPFYSVDALRDYGHFHTPKFHKAALLPDPFRLFSDGLAEYDGKAINFVASFYLGLHCKRVLFGDVFICKAEGDKVFGLSLEEVQFLSLDLMRSFGIQLPFFASA